ncbi:RebB family R body protein [Paraneptunicella aestuarii]|uniref:RebB family R body protein n=1 Tax=Paraneptunicella aestuarii TaxID=2831148 RepID=UPI001E294B08|nr:RebB family R body protein [Paraneptunicella aestuarii]UAA37900.1 RebB family R body protein [Paraneptunicella aestuarii]
MPVNESITDSITQTNTKVLGDTPASAMGNLFMSSSQALGTSAYGGANDQQQAQIVMQAATVQAVNSMMAIGAAVIGRASEEILEKG